MSISKLPGFLYMSLLLRSKKYILRLRTSSIPELGYRAKQALLLLRLKSLLRKNRNLVEVPIIDPLDIEDLKLPSFEYHLNEDIVEAIIRGENLSLNAHCGVSRRFEEQFRNIFFADIKQGDSSPDIRTVWEPARLQHIASLIVYALQTPEPSYSHTAKEYARDATFKWINENPFLFGPHYISVMECGLRIPVFFYCLKSLDNLSDREYRLLLNTSYLHAWWVSKRLSLYSSLGNHTIAECVGLIFAGAIFRKTRDGKQWIEKGFSLLKKELEHQILEDGGPAEQSLNYHRFILDLYWLSIDFLKINNLYHCTDIIPRLMRGEEFIKAFQDSRGNMPLIGDSDDGCAIAPGITPKRSRTSGPKKRINIFKYSGYTVINTENRVTLTFYHGPLGMPPLYNHGHADALSIILSKDCKEILVDPGTYRYNGAPEFRKYFKGTRAHNTVTVDGLDQAVQETGFIWSNPYNVNLLNCLELDEALWLEAVHDGYSRLKEPVWHKRSILFFDNSNFIIKDSFKGRGIHHFELNYHLHPDAMVSNSDGWWHVDKKGSRLFIQLFGKDEFLFVRGQEKSLLGWYSPSYGIQRKSGVLNCKKRGFAEQVVFVTAICTEASVDKNTLTERIPSI